MLLIGFNRQGHLGSKRVIEPLAAKSAALSQHDPRSWGLAFSNWRAAWARYRKSRTGRCTGPGFFPPRPGGLHRVGTLHCSRGLRSPGLFIQARPRVTALGFRRGNTWFGNHWKFSAQPTGSFFFAILYRGRRAHFRSIYCKAADTGPATRLRPYFWRDHKGRRGAGPANEKLGYDLPKQRAPIFQGIGPIPKEDGIGGLK